MVLYFLESKGGAEGESVRGGDGAGRERWNKPPPPPPFSANISEPVPAGAILTSLHPVGNLSQRMYGSIRIRYVTQLSAGTPLFQGAKCVPTSTMSSDLAGGRKYQNGTCFAPWNNGVPAAAKCAKKIILRHEYYPFSRKWGPPWGVGRTARRAGGAKGAHDG